MNIKIDSQVERYSDLLRKAVDEIRAEYPAVRGLSSSIKSESEMDIFEADENGKPVGPVLKTVRRLDSM